MTPDMARIYREQQAAADYLATNPHHRGAKLGLWDWYAEEALMRLEDLQKQVPSASRKL